MIGRSRRRWLVAALVLVLAGAGLSACATSRSSAPRSTSSATSTTGPPSTKATTTSSVAVTTTTATTVTTTSAAASTTSTSLVLTSTPHGLPGVEICSGEPEYEPTALHWCSSMCSEYVEGIVWSSWTPISAMGIGTLETNNGVPNCEKGTWTAHPGFAVRLSFPQVVTYCTENGPIAALMFTAINLWTATRPGSLPLFRPPCG